MCENEWMTKSREKKEEEIREKERERERERERESQNESKNITNNNNKIQSFVGQSFPMYLLTISMISKFNY